MVLQHSRLEIKRLSTHLPAHYEIKDPAVVALDAHSYLMYASIGNTQSETWLVGRFKADNPFGPWTELPPVKFHGLTGPQLCAPAVTYEEVDGSPLYTMYIQTACFEANGVIAVATSQDGLNFYGEAQPVVTRESVSAPKAPVIGLYDAGFSQIKQGEDELLCLVYSGYRRVGCGDIFLSTKKKADTTWSTGQCLVSQEDVPFHNRPDSVDFEWGLEGAKLIQLDDSIYLMIGVCFMPLPQGFQGKRQRVFFATSPSVNGPYTPIGLPFAPEHNEHATGENGHPDTLILDDQLVVIYQERSGWGDPWHLHAAAFDLGLLKNFLSQKQAEPAPNIDVSTTTVPSPFTPDHYYLPVNFS